MMTDKLKLTRLLTTFAMAMVALSSCTGSPTKRSETSSFVYGMFELSIPTENLEGAKIFKADNVAIKFSNDSLLAPVMMTHMTEELPESFDLRSLPEIYLNRAEPHDTDPALTDSLRRTRDALLAGYPSRKAKELESGNLRGLQICAAENCMTYITSILQAEQILAIFSRNIAPSSIIEMAKER